MNAPRDTSPRTPRRAAEKPGAPPRRPGLLFACAWLLATAAVCGLCFEGGFRNALRDANARAGRQLHAESMALQAALEKNEPLPFAMSLQTDVIAGLQHADSIDAMAALNLYLEAIATQAQVSAAYVVDTRGLTIAASNWNRSYSFVGSSYGFRPYVQDALAGRIGRFYGIGTTTAEPGYFLARPVLSPPTPGEPRGRLLGAVVLKIRLDDLERSWSSTDDTVALADGNGVVFLSNNAARKYRSLAPLSDEAKRRLADSQQYDGHDIQAFEAANALPATRLAEPVGPLDWELIRFVGHEGARRSGLRWAVVGGLVSALAALAAYAAFQRRERIRVAFSLQRQLTRASQDLEQRIHVHTRHLVRANAELSGRYDELQRAEQLLRETQDELVQAGKLGMLGQMAAGVTHELSQPLTAIRSFADNARAFLGLGDVESATANLLHIEEACERMRSITSQLKTFARKSGEALGPVSLAQVVDNALRLLRSDIDRIGAQMEVHVEPRTCVLADSIRLEQVVINLLRNALDAVQEATVRRVGIEVSNGPRTVLRITDSGPGIPEAAKERLFEPFFTTKPAGLGLGLGLAISSSIVEAMQGRLVGTNLPGGGACFVLSLPPMTQPEESPCLPA